jgi:hypothetical protein
MDFHREIEHLRRQIRDLEARLNRVPALEARHAHRRRFRMVKLTAVLTAGGKATASVQRLSYDVIPTPTSATWSSLDPDQIITVFDAVMLAAGLTSYTFPIGTLARVEQDPYSGIWYFSDFYACPTAPA